MYESVLERITNPKKGGLLVNCALWLNKRKVFRACDIPNNLDIAALRGYFLAGSLAKWLRANGGEKYAERLSKLSPDDAELNEKLAAVFGGEALPVKALGAENDAPTAAAPAPSVSSFTLSSYPLSSYPLSSYFGSVGSLRRFLTAGSFGSFWAGSFSQWEQFFAMLSRGYGSFSFTSFASFHEWEWEWLYRLFGYDSFGSFSFGSFGSLTMAWFDEFFGSFSPNAFLPKLPELDEYDRILLETLMNCPLDRFGYGIHNI